MGGDSAFPDSIPREARMNLSQAYSRIKQLNVAIFRTADVVALLGVTTSHATQILRRLAANDLVIPLGRGRWTLDLEVDRLIVAERLCSPHPSYISLQSALYHHGMISQIPQMIYSVTLAKSQRISNQLGSFSYHHINPAFFCGYEAISPQGGQMAKPEKALLDLFYLRTNNPRLFKTLPELELPTDFDFDYCLDLVQQIPSKRQRTIVLNQLERVRSGIHPSMMKP